jgi:nitroimidazol reductase NimA-like FMN-containing flavoprotein (pyridoxamine 5'-phosphate oxidase superfamily)
MTMASPVLNYTPPAKTGKLSQSEIDTFLAQPWNARLATVTPTQTPYLVAVWYTFEAATRRFYVVAREKAQFVPHIRLNPAVALHIADDIHAQHTRVVVEGQAVLVEGPVAPQQSPRLQQLVDEMAQRYMGEPGPGYARKTADRPRYLVEITPQRWQSWSGGEWAPHYR